MNITWLDIDASYSHSSLALPALEAQLTDEVRSLCTINIVSGTIKSSLDQIIAEVIDSDAQYILATGWLFNIDYLISVLSRVCSIDPNLKVILGGPEFLGDNREFLIRNRFVTSVFKGEGEGVFNDFIKIISNDPKSDEWLKLEGFEYLDQNDNYISKESVTVQNFIELTPPEKSKFFRWDKVFVQLETSRGCFNSCKFCVSGIDDSPIKNIPINSIRERLKFIESKGIKEIRILDRTFNGNAARATEMIDLFSEFNGKLMFHIEVHPALLGPSVKDKLTDAPANLLHIEAGIQSLDENVLCQCARKGSSAKAIEGLHFLLGLNKYEVHTDFIAGLPDYTFNRLVDDVNRMIQIAPHEIQLELLKLLPGTYFRNNSNMLGIKFSPQPPYEVLETKSISYKELYKCKVLSKIIEYWYNEPQWRDTFKVMVTTSDNFLKELLEELSATQFLETLHSFESKSLLLYDFCKRAYPHHLNLITLNWINCGLSLKKEPAQKVMHWNIKDKDQIFNPIFEELERNNTYYYFDCDGNRYWFTYNKCIDRNRPIRSCREENYKKL